MKDMKVYVLSLGECYLNSTYFMLDDTAASVEEPNAPHRQLHVPFYALLIDHPTEGWILYDTGAENNPDEVWTRSMLRFGRWVKPEGTEMETQLALVGVKPEEIKHVFISHLHQDHMGNAHMFKHANFYYAKKDMEKAALSLLAMDDEEVYQENFFWIREEVFMKTKSKTYIDEDIEDFFPGIDIIQLPGHTASLLGMVIHLENNTIIVTADAINNQQNYDGMRPGAVYDSLSWDESVKKVHRLEKKHNAKVFFGHDWDQFTTKIKKAPEYYD